MSDARTKSVDKFVEHEFAVHQRFAILVDFLGHIVQKRGLHLAERLGGLAAAVGQFGVSQTFSLHFPGGFRFRPRIRCQIPWEVVNAADGGTTGRIELGYLLDTTPIVDGSGNPVRSVGETRALDAAPGTLYTELLLADLDQEVVAAGGSELRVSVELFVVVSGGAGTADFRLNHDPAVPVDRMVVEVDTGE